MTTAPTIVAVQPSDPRAVFLMNAQQQELRGMYQDNITEPFDPAVLLGDGSLLLAAEQNGDLLACGALKRWDATTAELKRMYTRPEVRGQGLAWALLERLLDAGRALGYARLVLETGVLQVEAIRLYQRAGFVRIPNYGYYAGVEGSLCFELRLGAPATLDSR
ncbi:GNAT family N-acetyltransferase [Deinococcus sonorensis]|uniref:GNAT family N-acetyltransferase n=2 Tax=Deinococcus sonorensis TaxID=309891 RepID=A0AAU7UA99_9DEIO